MNNARGADGSNLPLVVTGHVCNEIEAASYWYEKMIEARDMFAVVYAASHYTAPLRASAHWTRLSRMMNLPPIPA